MDEHEVVLGLVEGIHSAALDPRLWPEVVARIGEAVGAQAGSLFVHDFADRSAQLEVSGPNIAAFTGLDPGWLEKYVAHYSHVNVWTANEELVPPGTAVLSSQLYPDALLKKTEFYGDWLHGQDLFHALGSVVEKEDTRATKLTFLRPERAGEFGERELRIMRLLMPHLRTAAAVHRRIHRLAQMSGSALGAIEHLAHGIVFVSASGRLLHWNGAARRISRRTGGLVIGGNGELRAATHEQSKRLAEAIRRACTPAGAGLAQPGTLLKLPSKFGEVQVLVAPAGALSPSPLPPEAAAALFVTELSGEPLSLARSLRAVYGASPAEAALGEALVNGKSLKAFADERNVSLNTVKTQLKGLSAKVGAKRQVDVVRVILSGPVMFRGEG